MLGLFRHVGRELSIRLAAALPAGPSQTVCEPLEGRVLLAVNAPSGLVAARVSDSAVQLKWRDNSGEDGFVLERSLSETATPVPLPVPANYDDSVEYLDGDGLLPNTMYYYRVKATKAGSDSAYSDMIKVKTSPLPTTPATWGSQVVGGAASDGNADETGGVFTTWSDTGPILDGNFEYASFPVTGNFTFVARVASEVSTSSQSGARAGIMLRDASGRYVAVATTPAVGTQGVRFYKRDTSSTGGSLPYSNTTGLFHPLLLKLVRTADRVDVAYSDGNSWTSLPLTLPVLATNLTVGLVVATDTAGSANRNTASFDRVAFVNDPTSSPVALSPEGLMVSAASSTSVNLAWQDHTNETSWAVDREIDGQQTWTPIATGLAQDITTFRDDTASAGTAYVYRVRAQGLTGSADVVSAASHVVTVPAAPATPEAPSNLQIDYRDTWRIHLTWTDDAATETGFRVKFADDTNPGNPYITYAELPADTTDTFVNVAPGGPEGGKRYSFEVEAFNTAGASAPSDPVRTFWAINPDFMTVSQGVRTHAIKLTWPAATGESGYEVWRASDQTGIWEQIATLAPDKTDYVDDGHDLPEGILPEETGYTYGLVVTDPDDPSVNSARSEVHGTTTGFRLFDAPQLAWDYPTPENPVPTTYRDTPDKPPVFDRQIISVSVSTGHDPTFNQDGTIVTPLPLSQERARAAAAEAKTVGADIVVDLEIPNWQQDSRLGGAAGVPNVQQVVEGFKQVVSWIRDEWAARGGYPAGRIGFYDFGVPRDQVYVNPTTSSFEHFSDDDTAHVLQWQQAIGDLKPLMRSWSVDDMQGVAHLQAQQVTEIHGVDFLMPVFNTGGTSDEDNSNWVVAVGNYLEQYHHLADEFDVPIYPIVSPAVQDSDPVVWSPNGMWRFELEWLRSQVDGIALWYSGNVDPRVPHFNPYDGGYNQPFYVTMQNFMAQPLPGLAPNPPDLTSVNPVGPHVTLRDYSTSDGSHDAAGWVVERSRDYDGAKWIPVAGAYRSQPDQTQTLLDPFAGDGTTFRYRVRAVNAFGTAAAPYIPVTSRRDAMDRIEGETFDPASSTGVKDENGGMTVTGPVNQGDHYAQYNDVDFGAGAAQSLTVSLMSDVGGTFTVLAIGPNGTVYPLAEVPYDGAHNVHQQKTLTLQTLGLSGIYDIAIIFGDSPAWVDWFKLLP